MRNYLKYIIVFIVSFIILWFLGYYLKDICGDESYMFSLAITKGEIIYKDFNIITTPLYFVFMSILLLINKSYIMFLLGNSLIITLIYIISEKLVGKNIIFLVFITVIFEYYNLCPSYNLFLILFLIILIYLEDKYSNLDYLIGFIIGICILSKHVIGVFFIIPSIIFYYKNISKLIKRFIGLIIPCFIFLFYLIINNCLYEFIDLCLFGLFDFNKTNGSMLGLSKIVILILSILIFIISFIFILFHKKDIRLYYLFFGIMLMIPLFDFYHFAFYVFCFTFMICLYIKINNYKYVKFLFSLLIIEYGVLLFFNLDYKDINFNMNNDNYKYAFVSKNYFYGNNLYKKFINKYKDPIILGFYTKDYTVNNNLKIDYFDCPHYGNFGYDGVNKMINRIKNSNSNYIIVSMYDYKTGKSSPTQFYIEVCDYVINNYKLIDSKYNFNVYYKE